MALVLADRVQEYSTTTGTGTLTLSGAYAGFQTFAAGIGNGNTCYYTITSDTNQWEVGIGTVGVGTLARTTLISSSTGSLVSFTGTLTVFVAYPAEKAVYQDANGAYIPASPVFNGNAIISDNSANAALRVTQIGAGNALLVEDSANPDATPFVIDAAGKVVVGHTATVLMPAGDGGLYGAGLEVLGAAGATSSLGVAIYNNAAAGFGGALSLAKSNSATVGSHAVVSNADLLGAIYFSGSDGTNFIRGAQITSQVDGVPGTSDMPGRLVFSTTADNASIPTERMRINNSGQIGVNGAPTSANYQFQLGGTLISAGTASYGFAVDATVSSTSTSSANMYFTTLKTQATSFVLGTATHFSAAQGAIGAGSSITNQYGFIANATLTGATNNYGFYSNIATATGRYNFYAAGTAANVFVGTTSIGGVVGAESLRVTTVASAVNYLQISGQATGGAPILSAQGSDANVNILHLSKNTGGHVFTTGSTSNVQFTVNNTTSAVNYLQVTGSASTTPTLSAAGSGADVDISLTPKGTGVLRFGTHTVGILAQSGYITIKDAAGNTRNLLVG
jgi:hypothetical protein